MSFYKNLHDLYNGGGEPISGPVEDAEEPQVQEPQYVAEDRRASERAEEERENIRQHMAELDRRHRYNEAVRAAQNVAIVGGLLWMFGDG